jgi:hypothetical protein
MSVMTAVIPVPVGVGEPQLRAGMGTFSPQDHLGTLRPRRQVEHSGDLGHPGAIPDPAV